jgi:general secretion pathway protein C
MRLRWLFTRSEVNTEAAAGSSYTLYWRMLGALVLGVVIARWSWVLFAPYSTAVAVVPEHGNTMEAGRLFGEAISAVAASDRPPSSNIRLIGVFAPPPGRPGFAILQLENKHQVGVAAGENVIPGTRLVEIHPNYVLLEHAGVQQRVKLEEKSTAASGVAGTPQANG